ncbi:MAG: hypothetical protein ACRDZ3_15465 [Acidimicrobiia bacterium]
MRRIAPRLSVILTVSSALTLLPLSASASSGVFHYCQGSDCRKLENPADGLCIRLQLQANHVRNKTNGVAHLFGDGQCGRAAGVAGPGETRSVNAASSVRFGA